MKDKKVTGSHQHGLTKRKSCLTNLIAFYNDMTGMVDEKRAEDIDYLDFTKVFDTISHSIITDELTKYRLD